MNATRPWFCDCHCHPTDPAADPDTEAVLGRAWEAGVRLLVAASWDLESCTQVRDLIEKSQICVGAFGFHPWFDPGSPEQLLPLLQHPRCVALGEIGLDSKVARSLTLQAETLDWQLDLASALDLPVVLHCRGAAGELLAALKRHRGIRGLIHGFHYEMPAARPFLDLGLHFSLSGLLTLEGDNKVKRLARALPLERILLETDSPALPVAGIPKLGTEPAHLPRVFQALCKVRPEPPALLAEALLVNAARALGPRLGPHLEAARRG